MEIVLLPSFPLYFFIFFLDVIPSSLSIFDLLSPDPTSRLIRSFIHCFFIRQIFLPYPWILISSCLCSVLFYLFVFLKILVLYLLHSLSLLLFRIFLLSLFPFFHIFSFSVFLTFSITFHSCTSYRLQSPRFLFPSIHITLFSVFFSFFFPWNNSVLFCLKHFFFHFLMLVFFLLIALGSAATSLDFYVGRTPFDSLLSWQTFLLLSSVTAEKWQSNAFRWTMYLAAAS